MHFLRDTIIRVLLILQDVRVFGFLQPCEPVQAYSKFIGHFRTTKLQLCSRWCIKRVPASHLMEFTTVQAINFLFETHQKYTSLYLVTKCLTVVRSVFAPSAAVLLAAFFLLKYCPYSHVSRLIEFVITCFCLRLIIFGSPRFCFFLNLLSSSIPNVIYSSFIVSGLVSAIILRLTNRSEDTVFKMYHN